MMPLSFDLKNPPTYEQILEDIKNHYKSKDNNLTDDAFLPGTLLSNIIEIQANTEYKRIGDAIYAINISLGNVDGKDGQLDNFLRNSFGIIRKPRVNGQVDIVIYGDPDITLDTTFLVRGENAGTFRLLSPITIPEEGKITTQFVELEFTTNKYKANEINNIITQKNGVHRIEQNADSTPGVPQETDKMFMLRAVTWGAKSNNGSFVSILSALANIPGVTKVNGYENKSPTQFTQHGLTFPPHSVAFVIQGGYNEDIAKVIYNKKPPGTAMAGTTKVNYYIMNRAIEYSFYRPTTVPLQFEIKVHLEHGYPSNYEDLIINRIIEFVDKQDINGTIKYTELMCALNEITMNFYYDSVKFGKVSINQYKVDNLSLLFTEMAIVNREHVKISKV